MKCKLALVLALLAAGLPAFSQTVLTYENDGFVNAPPDIAPNIDATTFINANQARFIINFTNVNLFLGEFYGFGMPPFETQNTLNYSNYFGATMSCNTGFRFQTFDSNLGRSHPASNFFNAGIINCGTVDTLSFLEIDRPFFFGTTNLFFGSVEGAKCIVRADHIDNPGIIHMGFESYLDIHGGSIDLSFGSLLSDTNGFSLQGNTFEEFFNGSIFDGYWGFGDVFTQRPLFYPFGISPAGFYGGTPPTTPIYNITTRDGGGRLQSSGGTNFVSYLDIQIADAGTNIYTTAVFLANTNPAVKANVYFFGGPGSPPIPTLEFTNVLGTSSNNIYAQDLFGTTTNFYLLPNGISGNRATFIPFNYLVAVANPFFFFRGTPADPTDIPPGTFPSRNVTNQWTAYEALFSPTSVLLTDIANQNATNIAGGMRVVADNYLNLSNSQVASLNYLLLKSTNHFEYGPDAQISSPVVDMDLRFTNSPLVISNLLTTTLGRPSGTLDLYSARWTNTFTNIFTGSFVTSHFHVLFADAKLSSTSPSIGQDVILRVSGSGNNDSLIIHDALTITHSLLLDAARITIATNDPGAASLSGSINITDTRIVWPDSAPRLQFFTNYGVFQAFNTVFFGGSRHSPYYTTSFTEPYQVFINGGTVTNFASLIEATIFQNSGIFDATGGSLLLISENATLTNGAFLAPGGSITLSNSSVTSSLIVSNHVLQAGGGPITLSAGYLLDDGTLAAGCPDMVTNKNTWSSTGLNLLSLPTAGATLLSTIVTNTSFTHNEVASTWAGVDRGNDISGFNPDNAPLGGIIFDGKDIASRFTFHGASANNALYVDYLEFDDYATNRDVHGNFTSFIIATNITVYFAEAVAEGVSIAEKLNGANNGHFVWVSNYNCGPFSSILLTNQLDGTTYKLNRALRASCNLDSDGDGIVNCIDPSPAPLPLPPCPCNASNPPLPSVAVTTFNPPGTSSSNSVSGASQLQAPVTSVTGVITQTFADTKGAYAGIFYDTNAVSAASSGYFTASTTDKGAVTAKLVMNGKTYSFSSQFNALGIATGKVPRGLLHSLDIQLQLDLSGGNKIVGSVSDTHWTAQLFANRLVFDAKKNPAAPYAGSYTLSIPGDAPESGHPSGAGFATVKIDSAGNVQLTASLADGTKFTQKTALSANGTWPLYASLYQGNGCGLGWLSVTNHNVRGQLVWVKPGGLAAAAAKSYSSGFTNQIQAAGIAYRAPARGEAILNWNFGNLILAGGGFSAPWTNAIFLNDQNRLTVSDNPSLKLTLTPSSGLFQGSILDPDTGKPLKFQGALFENINVGLGYFINSGQSGQVYLGHAP